MRWKGRPLYGWFKALRIGVLHWIYGSNRLVKGLHVEGDLLFSAHGKRLWCPRRMPVYDMWEAHTWRGFPTLYSVLHTNFDPYS